MNIKIFKTLVFVPVLFLFLIAGQEAYAGCEWQWGGIACGSPQAIGCWCDCGEGYCYCTDVKLAGGSCGNGNVLLEVKDWKCDPGSFACGGGGCFLLGTQVETEGGISAIEDISSGEAVASFDPTTKETKTSTVASQISKTSDSYYIIESDSGRTVKATDEHPFFLNDDGDEDKSITIKLKNFVVMTGIYMQDGWNMLVRTVN
jgi:hypothetical protein